MATMARSAVAGVLCRGFRARTVPAITTQYTRIRMSSHLARQMSGSLYRPLSTLGLLTKEPARIPGCGERFSTLSDDDDAAAQKQQEQRLKKYSKLLVQTAADRLPEEAHKVLSLLRTHKLQLRLSHYNAAIVACAGQSERAFKLLRELSEKGLKPDMVTLAAVIHVAETSERYGDALTHTEELSKMVAKKIPRRRVQLLEKAHAQMRTLKLPPPAVTCTALLMGHLDLGEWKQARNSLDQMQARGSKVSWPVLELVAVAFSDAGLAKEAGRIRSTADSSTVLNYSALSVGMPGAADQSLDDGSGDYYARMAQSNLGEAEAAVAWKEHEKNPTFYFG